MASLRCPHCQQNLEVQQIPAVGTSVRCFLCNTPFTITATKPASKPMPVAKPLTPPQPQQPAPLPPLQSPLNPVPPNYGYGQPIYQQPLGQPVYQAPPPSDSTSNWVTLLTIVVGGGGALVLVLVLVLTLTSGPSSKSKTPTTSVAEGTLPPTPANPIAPPSVPTKPVATAPPVGTIAAPPPPPPISASGDNTTVVSIRQDLEGKTLDLISATVRDEYFDFQKYRGKVVVAQFFASWSNPCRMLLPKVQELHAKYQSKGVEFVSVSLDSERVALTTFLNSTPIAWPVLFGEANQRLAIKHSITAPALVILDKHGKIVVVTNSTNNLGLLIENQLDVPGPDPISVPVPPTTTVASNTPNTPTTPNTVNTPNDPDGFFGGAPPEKFDESTENKPASPSEEIVAAPSVAAPAGIKYGWQKNRQYPFSFRFRVERGRGNFTQDVGRVMYTANVAETKLIQDILKLKGEGEGSGTGFVVHSDGLIATCDHVIRGATKIEITLNKKKYLAKVVARDPKNDLAIVRIDAKNLPTLPLGDSDKIRLLEDVYALGFPLSDSLGTNIKATPGTIAGLPAEDSNVLQLNAGINPGNSGGPMVNSRGEVVGVCSAKLVGEKVDNVGFAVPVNLVKSLLTKKKLLANGTALSTEKMDGPTVAETTTPATAYIRVTIGADVDNVMVLNFTGQENNSPLTAGIVLVTMAGEAIGSRDDRRLPGLMGSFGQLVIEKLPEEGEKTWDTSSVSAIPMPNTVGSGATAKIVYTLEPVLEKISYRISSKSADSIVINKKMEMVMMGKTKKVVASGNGTITFDIKLGLPRKCAFQSWYINSPGTNDQKTNISYVYEYAGGNELASAGTTGSRRPTPKSNLPRAVETGTTGDMVADVKEILAAIRSGQASTNAYLVLSQLKRIPPIAELRDEVSRELDKLLTSKDSSVRSAALDAVETWGTEVNVPTLMKLLDALDSPTRHNAMEALSKISKTLAVAEKIAPLLAEREDGYTAESALKSIGTIAEPAVLDVLVKFKEQDTRSRAIEVLGSIGTKRSLDLLQTIARDRTNSTLQYRAESALREIGERTNRRQP